MTGSSTGSRTGRPVVVVGAGGHAKVLIEALRSGNVPVLALIDRDTTKHGQKILHITVAGDDTWLQQTYPPGTVQLVNGVGSVRRPILRRDVFAAFKARGYDFATVIHSSTTIASDAVIGEGAQIMAGVVIQPGVRIGSDALINTRASVDHDCIVGDHSHVAPGATLSGDVHLGEAVHVGTGATLIQGIHVGDEALIAAGVTVTADVASGVLVSGPQAKEREKQ